VGPRVGAAVERGASRLHKEAVVSAGFGDTLRTLVVSGRPLRVRLNEYVKGWEERPEEIRELTGRGIVPLAKDMDDGVDVDIPFLMGQVAAVIQDVKPARQILEDMVREAVAMLRLGQTYIGGRESKL